MTAAIEASETGHLVFGTLHTRGAFQTINRIVDSFPTESQGQIRHTLADNLGRWSARSWCASPTAAAGASWPRS